MHRIVSLLLVAIFILVPALSHAEPTPPLPRATMGSVPSFIGRKIWNGVSRLKEASAIASMKRTAQRDAAKATTSPKDATYGVQYKVRSSRRANIENTPMRVSSERTFLADSKGRVTEIGQRARYYVPSSTGFGEMLGAFIAGDSMPYSGDANYGTVITRRAGDSWSKTAKNYTADGSVVLNKNVEAIFLIGETGMPYERTTTPTNRLPKLDLVRGTIKTVDTRGKATKESFVRMPSKE